MAPNGALLLDRDIVHSPPSPPQSIRIDKPSAVMLAVLAKNESWVTAVGASNGADFDDRVAISSVVGAGQLPSKMSVRRKPL
jgi:hypothetical protein